MQPILTSSAVLLAAASLAGCLATTPPVDNIVASCNSSASCDRAWQAAQIWITKNSKLPINVVTDTIIQTQSQVGTPWYGFEVIRSRTADNHQTFLLVARCSFFMGYGLSRPTLQGMFKDEVEAASR